MTLLDQPAVDLTHARADLARLRRRARGLWWATLALAAAGALLLATAGGGSWGVPLLIGAAAAGGLALLAGGDRGRLLTRLVAQGDAGAVPEVRAYADRLLSPRERSRLARSLRQAADAGAPGVHELGIIPADRAALVAGELAQLARVVGDARVPIPARAAALCRRLLCDAALSPLYNTQLTERDLLRIVARIRADLP